MCQEEKSLSPSLAIGRGLATPQTFVGDPRDCQTSNKVAEAPWLARILHKPQRTTESPT
jgi:hypothetical protein